MLEALVWFTGALMVGFLLFSYLKYRDVFHPLMFVPPMALFIYVYMPLKLISSGDLFAYVNEAQAEFAQMLAILVLGAFCIGCVKGSGSVVSGLVYRSKAAATTLMAGGYILGALGLLAWTFMIVSGGGIQGAFGKSNGGVWNDIGYVRDAVFLLLVGLLLLLTPEVWVRRTKIWYMAVIVFATPWLMQALLGARRGPTFVISIALGVSWYLARNKRPALIVVAAAGANLGLLMLLLVANRSSIYIGSDKELKTDTVGSVTGASTANEYIFSAACITASRQTGEYFWGKRYLAQVFARPIPRQIWPNKYADFGVPELEQNAGVAGAGLQAVMGWKEEPGAAAALVADLWAEFSWLAIPVAALMGWAYGWTWRRAVTQGQLWITQYTILVMLSVYMVTQSMEAVLFRLLILSIPAHFVWRKAIQAGTPVGGPMHFLERTGPQRV